MKGATNMDVEGQKTYFCPKCRKTLNADNFYSSNNAENKCSTVTSPSLFSLASTTAFSIIFLSFSV